MGMNDIRCIAYQLYIYDWLIQHDYTIWDVLNSVVASSNPSEQILAFGLSSGELWVCFQEFLDNEYMIEEYMQELIGRYHPDMVNDYLEDVKELKAE